MRKLPSRYNAVALPVVLSGVMSLLVSGIATFKALGGGADFLAKWLAAWSLAWPIAAATAIGALPVAKRIVGLFVETAER